MSSFNLFLHKPYVSKKRDKNGNKILSKVKTRVYLYIIYNKEYKASFKTEFEVIPIQWNFDKQRLKHQVAGAVVINNRIDRFLKDIELQYNSIRNDFPDMEFKEIMQNIKEFIKYEISPCYAKENKTFFEVFETFIDDKSENVSHLTVKKYETVKRSLKNYDPSLTFSRINQSYYNDYIKHLRQQKPTGRQKTRNEGNQKGLLNDSIGKYIEVLKNFMRWAYENNYSKNTNFQKAWFKVNQRSKKQQELGKNDIITLSESELMKFYNFDFSGIKRLERVKDVFCFMCFTLQRWSDTKQFNKEQITQVEFDGQQVTAWHFNQYKTGKEIIVPFIGYLANAFDILQKYDYILPIISEQNYNKYLKEACKVAGLNRECTFRRFIGQKEILETKPLSQFVSSHTGRRTGITILLNDYELPTHFVRDLSGHSDLKTLDKYLNKSKKSLINSLQKHTTERKIATLKIAR
ncbi:phage integrase SAM-like domain-containing protein [Sunxiuqinia sp. A32]|uniref:phage integrase SAM-like domain-containing protein n=1 Tax=Sunxiuqinia sp. A32 TaxID=3461496 RepID=UPI00404540A2